MLINLSGLKNKCVNTKDNVVFEYKMLDEETRNDIKSTVFAARNFTLMFAVTAVSNGFFNNLFDSISTTIPPGTPIEIFPGFSVKLDQEVVRTEGLIYPIIDYIKEAFNS